MSDVGQTTKARTAKLRFVSRPSWWRWIISEKCDDLFKTWRHHSTTERPPKWVWELRTSESINRTTWRIFHPAVRSTLRLYDTLVFSKVNCGSLSVEVVLHTNSPAMGKHQFHGRFQCQRVCLCRVKVCRSFMYLFGICFGAQVSA